jgi:Chromo (CHRromatin Organisation MOdifier) domain
LDLPPNLKIHDVFHVSVLRRYNGSLLAPPDPISVEDSEEFEVEDILNHRQGRSGIDYLVSFKGYDASSNEWLPEANLENAQRLLRAYKRRAQLS